MTRDDMPPEARQADGILARTAGEAKKIICCIPTTQALRCAQELEAAAVLIRGKFPLPNGK